MVLFYMALSCCLRIHVVDVSRFMLRCVLAQGVQHTCFLSQNLPSGDCVCVHPGTVGSGE